MIVFLLGGIIAVWYQILDNKRDLETRIFPLINRFLIEKRMVHDPKGDIEIVQRFWNFEDPNDKEGMVPDILIYADLLATGEGRNIETAGIIYEQRIKRYLW